MNRGEPPFCLLITATETTSPPPSPPISAANPDTPLPRNTARLLAVMFPADAACRQSQEVLVGEGFSRNGVSATLRRLLETGFLSKQRGSACIPDTYRLHLPELAQP